jgi:hypothetical protein
MSMITIVVKYGNITVVEGRLPKSRLIFTSAGLAVYQLGSSGEVHEDCIPNIAMNAALERRIPLISMRRVK